VTPAVGGYGPGEKEESTNGERRDVQDLPTLQGGGTGCDGVGGGRKKNEVKLKNKNGVFGPQIEGSSFITARN